ncbi:MAG: tetratricopeptide repeat protein [Thermosynechococcaceae cyanobacterium]
MVAFVKAADGLTIGFIEANFARDIDAIVLALQEHPSCDAIQFDVLTFADPSLRFLGNAIQEALSTLAPETDKKRVIVIRGLEQSISMLGDWPPMLQDLNFIRDDLVASLPYPLLLCLPDYAITRLAHYAPDFWAWKSGVFRFKTSEFTRQYAPSETLGSQHILGELELTEKRKRIGDIQCKAVALHGMAMIYESQGNLEQALSSYIESLELKEKIGDTQGKAATLHEMGALYFEQNEIDKALSLYKESLNLKEQIGDIQGQAATLRQMAMLYGSQGEIEQALSFYEEVQAIDERIGNIHGQSATLHQMATLYASQGEDEKALSLYEESLSLKTWDGDVPGKAATLAMMAPLLASLRGDFDTALAYLQESLQILRKLKSSDVATVEGILDQVYTMAET